MTTSRKTSRGVVGINANLTQYPTFGFIHLGRYIRSLRLQNDRKTIRTCRAYHSISAPKKQLRLEFRCSSPLIDWDTCQTRYDLHCSWLLLLFEAKIGNLC